MLLIVKLVSSFSGISFMSAIDHVSFLGEILYLRDSKSDKAGWYSTGPIEARFGS